MHLSCRSVHYWNCLLSLCAKPKLPAISRPGVPVSWSESLLWILQPGKHDQLLIKGSKADLRRGRSILHGVFQICLGLKFMAFLVRIGMHNSQFKGPSFDTGDFRQLLFVTPNNTQLIRQITLKTWQQKNMPRLRVSRVYAERVSCIELNEWKVYSGFKGGENHPGI